ncbi:DUF397 domain-containing protein [Spirillospora sp. NPDC127200]
MNQLAPQWRKASRSSSEGGSCVEVAALWRKSSRSNPQGGECVEVAALAPEIGLRDSKDPDGPHLHIAPDAFAAFLARVKGVSPA